MQIIERSNQRVLTTEQIAEAFGADVVQIHKNFNYNKKRFEEGKHYLELKGDELKEFKTSYEFSSKLKHSPILYLWTEKGAFLHAKSLNTDKAWDAYNNLVDDYFKKVEEQKSDFSTLSPQLQFMIMVEQKQKELEEKTVALQEENAELKKNMRHLELVVDNEVWLTENQKAEIKDTVKGRIGQLKSKKVDAHFQGLYGDLNTYFGVSKYDKIKRTDFDDAMEFVKSWYPKKKENLS